MPISNERLDDEDYKRGQLIYLKGDNRPYRIVAVWPGSVKIKPQVGTPRERHPFLTKPANLTRQPEYPYQCALMLDWADSRDSL